MKYVLGFLALWIGSFMIITEFISDLFYPILLLIYFLVPVVLALIVTMLSCFIEEHMSWYEILFSILFFIICIPFMILLMLSGVSPWAFILLLL